MLAIFDKILSVELKNIYIWMYVCMKNASLYFQIFVCGLNLLSYLKKIHMGGRLVNNNA